MIIWIVKAPRLAKEFEAVSCGRGENPGA